MFIFEKVNSDEWHIGRQDGSKLKHLIIAFRLGRKFFEWKVIIAMKLRKSPISIKKTNPSGLVYFQAL